jgi:hypothetical protein
MASNEEAAKYLALKTSLPLKLIGPQQIYRRSEDSRLVAELSINVLNAVEPIDQRSYHAPSPWHAAAWLWDIATLVGQATKVDGRTGIRVPYDPTLGPPVFRGQRDSRWNLIASLFRADTTEADFRALGLFLALQLEIFAYEENFANSPLAHSAAAQHYGLRTMFMDFTLDPRIAAFFACGVEAPANSPSEGVIYFLPLTKLAEIGGTVVLPPPWVKRLYRQRGLFLECSHLAKDRDLRDECYSITFPLDPAYRDSCNTPDAVLADDEWYDRTIAWIRARAETVDLTKEKVDLKTKLLDECGEPSYLFGFLYPELMIEQADGFVDMCEWLALKFVQGTPRYDLSVMEFVAHHNPGLFKSELVVWKVLHSMNLIGKERPNILSDQGRMFAAMEAASTVVSKKEAK